MNTYKFDFNLSAWISSIEIEASSKEEALEQLMQMPISDLINEAEVKETSISDIDTEIVEEYVTVEVSNISVEPSFYEYDTESEKQELIAKVANSPTLTLSFYIRASDNIEDLIDGALAEEFDIFGNYSYKYRRR